MHMGWMKWDDNFLNHPKFVRLERRAPSRGVHLFVGLVSYCKQQLTDGRVPRDMIDRVNGPPAGRWRADAMRALVEVGLVEVLEGGDLMVHGFLDWQASRRKIVGARTLAKADPTQESDGTQTGARRDSDGTQHGASTDSELIKKGDTATLRAVASRARAQILDRDGDVDSDPPANPPPSSVRLAPAVAKKPTSTSSAAIGKRNRTSRARTQCPADLKPTETTAELAWRLGFTDAQLESEAGEFIDYWRGTGRLMADWQATLRARLRVRADRLALARRKPRDGQWAAYQQQLRDAKQPVKNPAKPPAGFDQNVRSLFG